jgi:hypothetical protein
LRRRAGRQEATWVHEVYRAAFGVTRQAGDAACPSRTLARGASRTRRVRLRYGRSVAKPRAVRSVRRDPDALFAARKPLKKIPFEFVLAELEELAPVTRPLFGCHAVYVDEKIVFALRDKGNPPDDDGVWVATTLEHHAALRRDLPSLRSITVLAGGGVTGWQVLPAESHDFEESVLLACQLVKRGDARIGKVPGARRSRTKR